MKIIILSDSHGLSNYVCNILKNEFPFDMIIHLGDGASDLYDATEYTYGKIVYQLKGNCDLGVYDCSNELVTCVDEIKIFACHGHLYNVKQSLVALQYSAMENNCSIALFGHTHIPFCEESNSVKLFNPGSAMLGNYGVLKIENKSFTLEHKEL